MASGAKTRALACVDKNAFTISFICMVKLLSSLDRQRVRLVEEIG